MNISHSHKDPLWSWYRGGLLTDFNVLLKLADYKVFVFLWLHRNLQTVQRLYPPLNWPEWRQCTLAENGDHSFLPFFFAALACCKSYNNHDNDAIVTIVIIFNYLFYFICINQVLLSSEELWIIGDVVRPPTSGNRMSCLSKCYRLRQSSNNI